MRKASYAFKMEYTFIFLNVLAAEKEEDVLKIAIPRLNSNPKRRSGGSSLSHLNVSLKAGIAAKRCVYKTKNSKVKFEFPACCCCLPILWSLQPLGLQNAFEVANGTSGQRYTRAVLWGEHSSGKLLLPESRGRNANARASYVVLKYL